MMVMTLGVYVLWKGKKMKESMLCKRETYMMSLFVVSNIVVDNIPCKPHIGFFTGLLSGMFMP